MTKSSSHSMLLGDRIAAVTRRFGIAPCAGCTRRQQQLNRLSAAVRYRMEVKWNGEKEDRSQTSRQE